MYVSMYLCIYVCIYVSMYVNVAPRLVLGGPQKKQMESLSSVRQDVPSRAALKYNSSASSSYFSRSWLVPEGPNSMLGPSPQAMA